MSTGVQLWLNIIRRRLSSRLLAPEDFGAEYDRVAPTYARWLERMAGHARRILPPPEKLVDGMRILDLACGSGSLSGALLRSSEARFSLLGVDISRGMLAECRRTLADSRAQFLQLDALAFLEEHPREFDHILCGWGLAYLNRKRFFRSAAAALKPGGWLRVMANGADSTAVIEPAIRKVLCRHPEQLDKYVRFDGNLPADAAQLAQWGRCAGLEAVEYDDGVEVLAFDCPEAYLEWQEQSGAAAGIRRIFRDYEAIHPELVETLRQLAGPEGILVSRHPYVSGIWRRKMR